MSLFTMILEFDGGNYSSQLSADSPIASIKEWRRTIDARIPEVDFQARRDLANELENEDIVPLDGLLNVWCATALVGDELALLNIVKTVEE